MMVRKGFPEYVDYGIVGAAGVTALGAVCGALYAVPWSGCTPRAGAAREYNVLWGVRVSLQLTAAFWLLSPVIQLHETWSPYIPILEGLDWSPSVLCRVYLAGRLGFLEPCFLLTSLLTFKHSLSKRTVSGLGATRHCNRRIIGTATLSCIPLFVAQLLIAVVSTFVDDEDLSDSSLPGSFYETHTEDETHECDGTRSEDHQEGCTLCVFPLLSSLLSLLFLAYYLWRMWAVTAEMALITLNHSLEQRIRVFRNAVTVLTLLSVLCRSLSVLAEPKDAFFELMRLGDFVSVVLVVAAASSMLVLGPVRDARMADKAGSDDEDGPQQSLCTRSLTQSPYPSVSQRQSRRQC
eukprot:evm.model.scf_1388EXC.4 EVM.evm.TU.scf_1388EXC.4   scf_1388EXC:24736-30158(-)